MTDSELALTQDEATWAMESIISGISEDCWAAGWLHDIEYEIWTAVQDPEAAKYNPVPPWQRKLLLILSRSMDGWVRWSAEKNEVVYVQMDEWLTLYQAWKSKSPSDAL